MTQAYERGEGAVAPFDKTPGKADKLENCPKMPLRRKEKTRAAIKSTFTRLVFSRGFENVTVPDVVAEVGISRSTFYEHFSSREDVLRASMNRIFATIADCVSEDEPPTRLIDVVGHLWENRRLTDAIFSGLARAVLGRNQTDLIEQRLRQLPYPRNALLPLRLAATEIAEAQLALIESWMRGRAFCSVQQLSTGLHRVSRASALALIGAA